MGRVTDWIWVLALAGLWMLIPRFFSFNWLVEDTIDEPPHTCWRNHFSEFLEGIFMGIIFVFPWRVVHVGVMAVLMVVIGAVIVSLVLWRHTFRRATRKAE